MAAGPAPKRARPDARRALPGVRGGFGGEGLHGHNEPEDLRPSRGLAAQKKSPIASERDEEVRGLWRWLASRFDARRLVFIDESGFHTSMTRLRARAPRGDRAYGKVPRNRGKNQTLIASITLEGGMGEALAIEGGTDAELFEAYVGELLAPTLEAGQVVVLDGLGAHRTRRVRELVEARGADLLFLPSYSPDLNPIEEAFSKIKNIVRKVGARAREALDEAISEAMSAVTLEDVAGWFSHCGYEPWDQCS
jgi:transposase